MSYVFTIVGTRDNPLFSHTFGTSKHGAPGHAQFPPDSLTLNQFILHSSLDIVEEVQWTTGAMYLKCVDRFQSNYISCFLTGTGMKFLLLHNPDPVAGSQGGGTHPSHGHHASLGAGDGVSKVGRGSGSAASSVAGNPTGPAAEEAVRQFFADVYESWVKTAMNPFYRVDSEIKSPIFRQRVAAAARKYL